VRRRLFDLVAILSLLLGVAVAAVWACSHLAFAPFGQYWETEWLDRPPGSIGFVSVYRRRGWLAKDGSVHLFRDDRVAGPAPTGESRHVRRSGIDPAPARQLEPTTLGFARVYRVRGYADPPGTGRMVTDTTSQWSVPLPLISLLLLTPAVVALAGRIRRRTRHAKGLCARCGYDLRGNVSGVCPECGAAASPVRNQESRSGAAGAFDIGR
jgi:hypothetical protein